MKPLLIQYWGNSPFWREQTKPWKEYYYFSTWHLTAGAYVAPINKRMKYKLSHPNPWCKNYYVISRGNWAVLTENIVAIYTDDEYKQLLEV